MLEANDLIHKNISKEAAAVYHAVIQGLKSLIARNDMIECNNSKGAVLCKGYTECKTNQTCLHRNLLSLNLLLKKRFNTLPEQNWYKTKQTPKQYKVSKYCLQSNINSITVFKRVFAGVIEFGSMKLTYIKQTSKVQVNKSLAKFTSQKLKYLSVPSSILLKLFFLVKCTIFNATNRSMYLKIKSF